MTSRNRRGRWGEQEDKEKELDNQEKDDTERDGWRINDGIFMSLSENVTEGIDY